MGKNLSLDCCCFGRVAKYPLAFHQQLAGVGAYPFSSWVEEALLLGRKRSPLGREVKGRFPLSGGRDTGTHVDRRALLGQLTGVCPF